MSDTTKIASRIISEISARASDKDFRDFDLNDYKTVYWRSARELANKYQIFEKVFNFRLGDMTSDFNSDIILDIPDFRAETLVDVNGIQLLKVNKQLKSIHQYCYYLEVIDGNLIFNYILDIPGYPDITIDNEQLFNGDVARKNVDDEITIVYNILPEKEDFENSDYLLNQYEEELIKIALIKLAEIGMVKYANTEKQIKYEILYRVNSTSRNNETYVKHKSFPIMKPFIFLER